MELGILLFALAVTVFIVRDSIKNKPLPATQGDWFVVFDVDAEAKALALWFYPVVGFERRDNQTHAITSRPDFTKKLAATRPARKVNDSGWEVSVSYGRWLRDGVPFDEAGNPDYQDSSDFASTVENYLLGEFKLSLRTPVPVFYQQQIQNAVQRAKREP